MDALLADLRAEMEDLDLVLAGVGDLDRPTPAEGWTVRDTVSHLAMTDREAVRAATDPDAFVGLLGDVAQDPDAFLRGQLDEGRQLADNLLPWWRAMRARLLDVLAGTDPAARVPWYGPPMSPASFATARLMEYWAHGQDVADATGVWRVPTRRLRHIAFLGVRTRAFSYTLHGLPVPDGEVHVVLDAPAGETWEWGDPTVTDSVTGPAEDFCLLVTQRRHPEDLALKVVGPLAEQWVSVAQAFAGLPSTADPNRKGMRLRPPTA